MMPRLVPPPEYPEPLVNLHCEFALLGALMRHNSMVDPVAELVAPEDFAEPLHQRIYSVILREVSEGRSATPPLLRSYFIDDPDINDVGGIQYLAEMTANDAVLIGAWDFARSVADLAKRRRLLDHMRALTTDISAEIETPVESLVDRLDTAMSDALQRQQTTNAVTIAQQFDRTIKSIEDEAAGLKPRGIRVQGLDDWNYLTGDMRRGEMIVLAGRPSMGKTALAITTALSTARAGHGVLFISLEMSADELMTRAISDLCFEYGQSAGFDAIRKGQFNGYDRERLDAARDAIASWPMILTDPPQMRIGRLAMMIRRFQRQMAAKGQSLDVVFVDYLGLIRSDDRKAKRYEEVSEISRAIKRIAKECGVAIVILAQLNREVEKREDKRPQLSDLRDSGDIEQDADTVIFVYREEYYLERSEPDAGDKKRTQWEEAMNFARNRVEIIAAKRRQGRVGKRNCWFFGSHQAVRGSGFFSGGGR